MNNLNPPGPAFDSVNSRPDIQETGENLQEKMAEMTAAGEATEASREVDEDLQQAVNEFVSLFLQQMFSNMRDTIPEGGIIDGGYAEDVFTEMMDEEISELGAGQSQFKQLNQAIYRQLDQNK